MTKPLRWVLLVLSLGAMACAAMEREPDVGRDDEAIQRQLLVMLRMPLPDPSG